MLRTTLLLTINKIQEVPQKNSTYKKSILKELFICNKLSCAELSAKISKSPSLVTRILAEMLAEGLVIEGDLAPSSGGRRALTYSVLPTAFYIVGVAMDQFVTRITILNAHRDFIIPVEKIELGLAGNEDALQTLSEYIVKTIKQTAVDVDKIMGIGIGMPGFIDPTQGANFTFLGGNICSKLREDTGLPVFIDNDSTVVALAEFTFGKAKREKNAVVINIGWGIGLGMLIDGKLFRGNDGFAGELSHIPLFKNGKLCSCGKIGCLETETSLTYMLEKATDEINSGKASFLKGKLLPTASHESRSDHFLKAAQLGDSLAIEILSNAAYDIGRGIAILIHLLNPGKIILSGRCSKVGHIWLPPIQRALNEFCIPRLLSKTEVEVSNLNYDAEILGSALLVTENMKETSIEKIFNYSQ